MDLPNLPVVGFYENAHDCFNFIHIRQLPDSRDLIRCAEHRLVRGHSETYDLFKKELAKSLAIDDSTGEFYNFLFDNYKCVGGGSVYIFAEGSRWFKEGMKRECWIRGESSTYGATDLDLVKRVLEETGRFDVVGIGHMPIPA